MSVQCEKVGKEVRVGPEPLGESKSLEVDYSAACISFVA